MTGDETIWLHCNGCSQETRHRLITRHLRQVGEGEEVVAEMTYDLFECCGCDQVCLRESGHWTGQEFTHIYPPRVARRSPDWLYELPTSMASLVEEVYAALHSGSSRLAMMGARALFDMLANDQVGDVGSFGAKLAALEAKGFISAKNREVVAAAIDAGSATAHRGHEPGKWAVSNVMDILENVLQSVYALESRAKWLKKYTPPREK